MTIANGTRLGPYEILAPIGAGGMGEVYRARDTRLERTVAIKVLPAHLSADPLARQRFEREARAVSALNHPNICSLYDVGHQDGTDYLVMEYLEGETLAARIQRGPLGLDELLRVATQIADALDKAHKQGVVHRDVKPGNVMLTKGGAKLLDFGLAKSTGQAPGLADLTSSPTVSKPLVASGREPLTAQGAIVGTFQYMAPEQLEGKEADARSDIFAFGATLYEMATGQKAFAGRSQASLIAAILEREPPPMAALAPMTPPALERVVRTCLAKDPDERRQTMHDVLLELRWIAEAGSQAGAPAPVVARRRIREMILAGSVAVLAVATAMLAWLYFRATSVEPVPARTYILPPEKAVFRTVGLGSSPPQISPDGTRVAFIAGDSQGKAHVWIRALNSLTAQPLPGSENGSFPFWAPDSRNLGFFVGGLLKRIDTFGGPPQSLCASDLVFGGTWNREGTILFAPSFSGPIYRATDTGGEPIPVTKLDSSRREFTHRWPYFLPDSRHFLFLVRSSIAENSGIYVGSLDGGPHRKLVSSETSAIYVSGHVLYLRENTLVAQAFDAARLELTGDAIPVAENVSASPGLRSTFSASENGTLAYGQGAGLVGWRLRILDRAGKETAPLGDRAHYTNPAISPDGRRVAVSESMAAFAGPADLWILDVARGLRTRLTFDPTREDDPVWSPDGTRIAFSSNRKGNYDLYVKSSSGVGEEELLLESSEEKHANDWSRDGRFLAYMAVKPDTGTDVWILPLEGDRKPFPFLQSSFNEMRPVFSSDGKWIAYMSTESGQSQVYIAPFPNPTSKWQVSVNGGIVPKWRADGKELFFQGPDLKMMAAEIRVKGSAIEVGTIRPLFEARLVSVSNGPYAVFPDGQRFLVNSVSEVGLTESFVLVTNWPAEIKKKR